MIICGDGRNLQKDKHHCNTPPIWALWRCGQTQSSPQCRRMKTHFEFAKKHLKDPQTLRNKILWSDEPQFQASCLKGTGSAHHLQSSIPKVKCAGISLMLWSCFSAVGDWGTHQNRRKAQCTKILRFSIQRAFRTSDWAEGSPSNRTMTINTQQEWLIDNSVNVLVQAWTWMQSNIFGETWKCVSAPIQPDRAWEVK